MASVEYVSMNPVATKLAYLARFALMAILAEPPLLVAPGCQAAPATRADESVPAMLPRYDMARGHWGGILTGPFMSGDGQWQAMTRPTTQLSEGYELAVRRGNHGPMRRVIGSCNSLSYFWIDAAGGPLLGVNQHIVSNEDRCYVYDPRRDALFEVDEPAAKDFEAVADAARRHFGNIAYCIACWSPDGETLLLHMHGHGRGEDNRLYAVRSRDGRVLRRFDDRNLVPRAWWSFPTDFADYADSNRNKSEESVKSAGKLPGGLSRVPPGNPALGNGGKVPLSERLAGVFAAAIKEHQSVVELINDADVNPPPMPGDPNPGGRQETVLGDSETLDEFVEQCHDAAAVEGPSHAEFVKSIASASKFLDDNRPAYRAVACEFLGNFPAATIEAGLVEKLGNLLPDVEDALPGITWVSVEGAPYVWEAGMTVGEVAKNAVGNVIGAQFDRHADFAEWWAGNRDCRARLWYWAQRIDKTESEADRKRALADLATLPPRDGLRVLLLGSIRDAIVLDARLPVHHGRAFWDGRPRFSADELAEFVKAHSLKGVLMDVVHDRMDWAPADEMIRADIVRKAVPALALLADKADVKKLEESLTVQPPLFSRWFVVTELCELDPPFAEEWLLAELAKSPTSFHARLLIGMTGLKHVNFLQRAFASARGHDLGNVLRAVAEVKTPRAAAALKQWIELTDWKDAKADGNDRMWLLKGFIDAAAILNDDEDAIGGDLIRRNNQDPPQGSTTEQAAKFYEQLAPARAEAAAELARFFARVAKGAGPATQSQ